MKLGDYELNQIYTGDARELSRGIPDESINLIFTDPVYDRIDDYRWLAETAARVLKPDSACLVWNGIGYLDLTIDALRIGGLSYKWQMGVFQPNGPSRRASDKMFSKWYSLLWFEKGISKPSDCFPDMRESLFNSFDRGNSHDWRKNPATIQTWLKSFSCLDAIIFDPFTGGGTVPAVCKMLRRNYLAFEIDPTTADLARARVAVTHPPLPFEAAQQVALPEV